MTEVLSIHRPAFCHEALLIIIGLFLVVPGVSSQPLLNKEPTDENHRYSVQYLGQFPSPEKGITTGFFEKLGRLVLGGEAMQLSRPVNILATDPGSFWSVDQGNGLLFRNNDGTLTLPRAFRRKERELSSLVGIASTGGDNLIFTDSRENKVFLLTEGAREPEVFNKGIILNQPTGIAYSPLAEEIWVSETASHRITVLDMRGKLVKHIGSRGTGKGEFNYPTFIWIDKSGMAYVVDAMNFRIQIFDRYGRFVSSFGEPGNATGYFARPKGVAVDSRGNIYVADALFNAVQIFDREGNFLYYFGLQGRGRGQFWMPSGIFIDGEDRIYIADSYNARIQIFQLKEGGLDAKN